MASEKAVKIRLEQKHRKELLHLLADPGSGVEARWEAFWQAVLARVPRSTELAAEVLARVFEEGMALISSRSQDSGVLSMRWVREVSRVAAERGLDKADFLEILLTRHLIKQGEGRDQVRIHSPETRQKILTAALEVFSAKGYHGATVDLIAERAGFGKGTVYRHFRSKRLLFSELIRTKVAELEEEVNCAIDPEADVLETIEAYLRVYFEFFDRNRDLYKVLIQEQSDFGAEVKALYIGNILRKIPLLKRKIFQAARDGRLKRLNFQTVFYGVMGFVDGVIQKWLASDGRYSLVEELPTVVEIMFHGFVQNGGSDHDFLDGRSLPAPRKTRAKLGS
ncbi:MAG: TetR/AcrR family transcriptional regulator [Deltaproteobacteria bacterium]|nr:TetR/AcrR family transcriptional regulator [Deltaproteobacteria bacterium]MBW2071156.1 TetR/AcrR family transcriptional regulator [Deltaproteobacteria bacterium]